MSQTGGTVASPGGAGGVALGSAGGRWILAATVAGSGMAFLDGTVVNVALPTIGRELTVGVAGLQWILNGYMLTLAALILLSGSLGDRYGRRRVFQIGVAGFAVTSAACAAAPDLLTLVLARVAQGVGGALMTPGSLAIIESSIRERDRPRAIGAWSGLTGIATAIGPFLGGWLVDVASWRLIFLLNLPLAAAVLAISARHVPESRDPAAAPRLDGTGSLLAVVGLGGVTYALIAAGTQGLAAPAVIAPLAAGVATLAGFAFVEWRSSHPMLPPDLFASRQFTAANLVTVTVYAALGAVFFLLVLQLQQVLGYSALQAGAATLPITALMLALSARSGQLAARIGPRPQMAAGPLVMAAGLLLLLRVDTPDDGYLATVFPAVAVLGLGLAVTVAPLTATALAAAGERRAGVASGTNNTIARTAQLIAVAVVPLAAGITGASYRSPQVFSAGFQNAMVITAALAATGGVLALVTIRNPLAGRGEPKPVRPSHHHCSLDGAPLESCPRAASGQHTR